MHACKTGSEISSVLQESDKRSSGLQMWMITVKNIKEQSMLLSQGLTGLPEDSRGQTAVVEVTVGNGNNSKMSGYGNGNAIHNEYTVEKIILFC